MPFIEESEVRESTLALTCMELAAMLDTYPVQVCRWHDDGLLIRHDGKFYEPMQAITAIADWEGRGRVPKPVMAWRKMLGEKPNRAAFLDGMACAFNLISEIMGRTNGRNSKFFGFAKFDPAYVEGGAEGGGIG